MTVAVLFVGLLGFTIASPTYPASGNEEVWEEDFGRAGKSYSGHKLVKFDVKSAADKETFDASVLEHGLDVWSEAKGRHAVVRVPPSVLLQQVPLAHTVIHDNIESLLHLETRPAGKGFHERYHSAAEIDAFAQQLVKRFPEFVSVEKMGATVQGRPMNVVHVAAAGKPADAPIVYVQAGQHAREWIGPAAAMVAIEAAAQKAVPSKGLPGFQLSVLLLANPDGYTHTMTVDRMWRKNRDTTHLALTEKTVGKTQFTQLQGDKGPCVGVDLNRNWPTHWGSVMKAGQVIQDTPRPCSETFVGFQAEAEPEVHNVVGHLSSLGSRVKAFLDVHSYSQRLLPPGCNGYGVPAKDAAAQMHTAKLMVAAMGITGAKYETGDCGKEMYVCSGTAADWAYYEGKILHSFSLELRPTDAVIREPHGNGFVLPPSQIRAAGHELLAGIIALSKASTGAPH